MDHWQPCPFNMRCARASNASESMRESMANEDRAVVTETHARASL